jgi:Zn-finger nucleic acid-binding protein
MEAAPDLAVMYRVTRAETKGVGTDQVKCPGCSGALMTGQVDGFRQYLCTSCGGAVIGIAVLRQVSSAAQHIWTAEPAPAASQARCPFCSAAMESRATQIGCAAICKLCEVVWLDKAAVSSLPAKDAVSTGQPTLATETPHCEQCGAPIAHTWDERCPYCGAAIHAPTQVVLFPTELRGDHDADWGPRRRGGLLSGVLDALADGNL